MTKVSELGSIILIIFYGGSMHFTDEEKEIIKKIALKERYTLNDFFRDNYEKRPKENLHRDWRAQNGWNNFPQA